MTKKEKYILLKMAKLAKEKLGITKPFNIFLSESRDGFATTGYYDPKTGKVAAFMKNRAVYDVARTILHELCHLWQDQNNRLNGQVQNIGGEIEDEANAKAGSMMKEFAQKIKTEDEIDIYNLG
jgi:hypothetical protein